MTQLREDYVRLLCACCGHTLDRYRGAGDGHTVTYGYLHKRTSQGPNGKRITYTCKKCRARHVLLEARLLTLVPQAHNEGKSILTSYLLT